MAGTPLILPIFWTQEAGFLPFGKYQGGKERRPGRIAPLHAWGVSTHLRRNTMKLKLLLFVLALALMAGVALFRPCRAPAGEIASTYGYKVLEPIRHGNLTVFPVIAAKSHDTAEFITLDEGLRSGEVVVTESVNISPLMRPRHRHGQITPPQYGGGAQVNQLVLVNNSKRPLILLAGEIVTGGKQDRIIGKDRLVPAESDPIDLSVFCVEPGRWVAASGGYKFKAPVAMGGAAGAMVQPSVRSKAMADKDQSKVWDEVRSSKTGMAQGLPSSVSEAVEVTSSYAGAIQNEAVQHKLESVAAPVQQEYQSVIRQLRDNNAVGVMVDVNGEIIRAD